MTKTLTVDGGTLAYEVTGSGPLIVLAHGIGDSREAYRAVTPALVDAGYRVAALDLRGTGGSSTGWTSYTRTDVAHDVLALVDHLGGPAVLVGHSFSGGAVTIAAAQAPSAVTAVVELAPFTRRQSIRLADLRVARYRRGTTLLLGTALLGSVRLWKRYLDVAQPGLDPAHRDARLARIEAMLREPGRMGAMRAMGMSAPLDADAALGGVRCPVLVVEGELDPDWASPRAEGEAIVAALPSGLGRLEVVPGVGHYPHVEAPSAVATTITSFLGPVRA